MSRPRAVPLCLSVAFLAVAVAFLALRLAQRDGGDDLLGQARERIARLKAAVEDQRTASERAVAAYAPKVPGKLDDLSTSAEALLRLPPGVAQVEVAVSAARPSARIVHLRDWHYVPRDLYALDARQVYGRDLTEQEIDAFHEEHLLQVELVQLEQVALLRCLAKHHGLRRLLAEGMTWRDVPLYQHRIDTLRDMGKRLPTLQEQLPEVRGLMKGMAGREGPQGPNRLFWLLPKGGADTMQGCWRRPVRRKGPHTTCLPRRDGVSWRDTGRFPTGGAEVAALPLHRNLLL